MMTEFSTDRLRLAPLTTDLRVMSQLVEWLSDPEVTRYSEQRHRIHTIRTQYEYADSFRFPSIYRLIKLKTNDQMIGSITAHVDTNNNIADLGILIGDKQIWHQGYGHEAWQAMICYLFATRIRKITAGAMACNKPMIDIFRKNAMYQEGVLRSHYLLATTPVDVELWGRHKIDG
jgi:RimJ/RimL family protein N-acetyltransferase